MVKIRINGQDKNKSKNKRPFQVNLIGTWRGGGGIFIKSVSGDSNVQHRVKGNSGILVARIFLSVFQPMGSKFSRV